MKPPAAFNSSWSDPPPPDEADDPLIGTTLQRTYRVTRIIGEGGMGRVYEATHTRIKQKRYALKVLHPEFSREPEIRHRFQREAEAAASVTHPNVVGVYDVALTDQGWPFLVCEFLEGMDFAALVKSQGCLAPALAVHVALQVCDALITAHDGGIIHRDLKPQNIFILGDSDETRPLAKVLDFGLSRFLDASDNELTKTGMIMGTPSYMAPEQARGERADRLTDVYGVGAILYAAVTGRPPFNKETPQATLLAVMNEEPARPHTLSPAVSVYLELVIQKAMAKKASERYPDMRSLRLAIAALDVGNRNSAAPPPRQPSSAQLRTDEVQGARGQLVLHVFLALTTAIAALGAAVSGAIYLIVGSWPFSQSEVVLVGVATVGTLLTPAFLLFKKLRQGVWGSTARVVSLLQLVRTPLLAGVVVYGLSALTLRFVDSAILGRPHGPAWPGWNVILSALAFVAVILAWARERWLGPAPGRIRRLILGPLSVCLLLGVAVASLVQGHVWHAAFSQESSKLGGPLQATLTEQTGGALETKTGTPAPTSAPAPAPKPDQTSSPDALSAKGANSAESPLSAAQVSAAELSAATAQGVPGLLPLSKQYPKDPRVLKALAMAYGSRSAGLGRAMETLKQAFSVEPKLIQDKDLQYMVRNTTQKKPPTSTLAYKLLAESMGSEGLDLLYKLSLTKPNQRRVAIKYLSKPKARKRFSPALSIAYDLRFSNSCAGRLPLLPRARSVGDQRSISVLSPLSTGTSRGCGFKKRKPCRARCPSQAAMFKQTIADISKRLADEKQ